MAIKVNQKDISSVMCPAVNGTRSSAQAVRIHNGSSWVDVWSSIKIMALLSNTITVGSLYTYSDGGMQYSKFRQNGVGTLSGTGTLICYLDGEWTNPTISFDYFGGAMYDSSNNVMNMRSAGTISAYHRIKGSTNAGTTTILSSIGVSQTSNDVNYESGTASKTLSGTFDRIGLQITINSYSNPYSFGSVTLQLGKLKIGTQSIGFPASAEVFNQA